ncbi:hypothetical protein LTR06_011227 [Exophiala xenobiotica]|nr:hypothetical protein LTR06_011227 [Exophiala xenobiotica]
MHLIFARDLGEDLQPSTHKLCRRIWWLLYSRDVLFCLSGFSNARCIDDEEVDVTELTVDDWVEESVSAVESFNDLPPATTIHMHYFLQNCRLAALSAEFLRIARHKKIAGGGLSTITEFPDAVAHWRRSLPKELLPTEDTLLSRVTLKPTSNVWMIVLLAMSFRLECLYYRTARDQLRPLNNSEAIDWCTKQLFESTFELDTLLNRAVVHDLVQYAPSSLIVCALNLLAFHIEIGLDKSTSFAMKIAVKARIHTCLSYLQSMSDHWRIAKWSLRVSNWVVRRSGLGLTDATTGTNTPANGQAGVSKERAPNDPNAAHDREGSPFTPFAFDMDDILMNDWMQDFVGENLFNQLGDGFLEASGI